MEDSPADRRRIAGRLRRSLPPTALAYVYEIVEFTPGQRLVMRTAEGPFPMETTYTWAPATDASTRMTLRNRGEPGGFSRLAAPLMTVALRRANRKDLERLKTLLEGNRRDTIGA